MLRQVLTGSAQLRMDIMKILTLNTHSLQEENYRQKLDWFIEGILKEKPDLIALQEVNQTAGAVDMDPAMLEGQYPIPGCVKILQDNHAAQIAHRLNQAGIPCSWAWLPVKLGWGKYDEGVAILSLGRKIRCVDQFPISKSTDYTNWRTRAVLGVQLEGLDDWFYCLHMGWWNDAQERFLDQWKVLNCCIASKRMCGTVWLMGDFNAPDCVHGQSYEHIIACGWVDTHITAAFRDTGITTPGIIAGWPVLPAGACGEGLRLDYIWCSQKKDILSSRVMFNGTKEPVVSDHFGVLIETREK